MKIIIILFALLAGLVYWNYNQTQDYARKSYGEPFELNSTTCKELIWMSTDPCWRYHE